MVRNTSTMRDADGWSWRFKNDKADTTIPIQNPFHKEECESYGCIVDSFIANKKSRVGKRFGFVRFIGVKNEEELANALATIWIGSYHLFAAEARFKRKETYAELPKKTVENNRSQIPDNKVEQVASTQSKKTYASTSNGDRGSKAERQETKMKQVTLSDHESVQINNSPEIALVKGLWLWLQFQNEETCNALASQETDSDSHGGDEGDKERDFESVDDIEEDEQVAKQ
nr:hypothetical protein [Tanacetum cinerariifolium]